MAMAFIIQSHYDFDLIDEEKLSVELYFFNEFSMLYCKIALKIWIELQRIKILDIFQKCPYM